MEGKERRKKKKKSARKKRKKSVFEASFEKWHLYKPQANESHRKWREKDRGREEQNLKENSEIDFAISPPKSPHPKISSMDGISTEEDASFILF